MREKGRVGAVGETVGESGACWMSTKVGEERKVEVEEEGTEEEEEERGGRGGERETSLGVMGGKGTEARDVLMCRESSGMY